MKNIYKLAFTGKMGSGKTTASLAALGLFTEKYGPSDSIGYVIKFANPLYQCAAAFHCKEKPRTFLQRVGDLARREFGDDIMERIFEENVEGLIRNKIPQIPQNNILVMTDDLRFKGEFALVKKLGFTTVKIDATEEARKRRIGDLFNNTQHRSEMEMEQCLPDFVVSNDEEHPHALTLETQLKDLFEQNKLIGD